MPVCPNCGVAYIGGERHACQTMSGLRVLWKAVQALLMVCGVMFIALVVLLIGVCGGFR